MVFCVSSSLFSSGTLSRWSSSVVSGALALCPPALSLCPDHEGQHRQTDHRPDSITSTAPGSLCSSGSGSRCRCPSVSVRLWVSVSVSVAPCFPLPVSLSRCPADHARRDDHRQHRTPGRPDRSPPTGSWASDSLLNQPNLPIW